MVYLTEQRILNSKTHLTLNENFWTIDNVHNIFQTTPDMFHIPDLISSWKVTMCKGRTQNQKVQTVLFTVSDIIVFKHQEMNLLQKM